MARTRRPRLSWFRLYVDDFLGGVAALTAADTGAYVFLLLAQWGTKEAQALSADPEELRAICKGQLPSERVMKKFVEVNVGGQKCFRNERLAQEWAISKAEFDGKSSASKGDVTGAVSGAVTSAVTSDVTGADVPTIQDPRSKIQDPLNHDPDPETTSTEPAPPALPLDIGLQTKKRRDAEMEARASKVLEKFTDVFNAAYNRHLGVPALNGKAQAHLRGIVKAYGVDGACRLPILAYLMDANDPERIKKRAISDLLHDGTNGTFEWSKLFQTASSLPPAQKARALEIAEKVGLSEVMREILAGHG